jgi:hypothetical protein
MPPKRARRSRFSDLDISAESEESIALAAADPRDYRRDRLEPLEERGDRTHIGGWASVMAPMIDPRILDGAPDRREAMSRTAWASTARWLIALLCVVAASLTGSASGRVSPAHIAAAQDTNPRVDAQRDAARNLLPPHAENAPEGVSWRSVGSNGPQPDPHFDAALSSWETIGWFAENDVGLVFRPDRKPHGLAIRAGYSRAPPTVIGRSRTSA